MGQNEDARKIDLEWEKRVLCSDESCIGTIGPDGRCRECGLKYEGELPQGITELSDESAFTANDDGDDSDWDDDDDFDSEEDSDEPADADDEWAKRTLCRDESCIGVIGPDGKCKECGKPY